MFWKEPFQLVVNTSTVSIAFGCEAWLSDFGAAISIAVGGLCFTLSALLFTMANALPRLGRTSPD
jgi:F0F1-type ATP synthase assembly protein I